MANLYGTVTISDERRWQHVPLYPALLVFEDREDGSFWVLTHTEDETHVAITTDFILPRFGTVYFAKTDGGPYLNAADGSCIRLFVRNGNLAWEECEPHSSPPVLTRRGISTRFLQLYLPVSWPNEHDLAWREWTG